MKLYEMMERFGEKKQIDCAGNGKLFLIPNADPEDFDPILTQLEEAGYTLFDRHQEGNVSFAVLQGEDGTLTASYVPHNGTIRLAFQPGEVLPDREKGEKRCTPLLTQVKLSYFTDDCGMTYVIRLHDGRFVLIDGGVGKYDEASQLMNILTEQNVLPRITIAAWFITHPHGDHFGGFVALMEQYAVQVDLQRLLFNWPAEAYTGPSSPMERFDTVIASMGDIIVTPHSGQHYHFSGLDVDVLFTCDDLYPHAFPNINDSSIVMRMTLEGRRILFPGDGQEKCSAELCARYGSESLRSEFLQVPHHGYWGGSDELFARVDPEIVLWPCPDFWYQEIQNWDCNRFFKESKTIRQILVGGQQQVTIDMTAPVPAYEAYPSVGDVLMDEKFDHGSMVALHWTCVTGGSTGYRPLTLEFADTACHITADDARSVCELLQPGRLTGANEIRVRISGSAPKQPALFGLWFTHARPTVWTEEDILPLKVGDDGRVEADLKLDRTANPDCGLYLLLQEGEITLDEVRIERL